MNILIKSYNTCCQNKNGGVQFRLRSIADKLKNKGENVELFNEFTTDINQFEIIHFFKLEPENYALLKCAKSNGLKVVISSVIGLSDNNGKKLRLFQKIRRIMPFTTTMEQCVNSLELADLIIAETEAEKLFIVRNYNISSEKIVIIPNGVEYDDYKGKEIYKEIGGEKKYILQVGRFDKNKNQLNVIKAMKDTGIDIVFIGGKDHSENNNYYQRCIDAADGASNIHFLGWLDADCDLMRSAYANADTLILPSYQETFGMVAIEGGVAGAKLALSNTLPILGYPIFDECAKFNPGDIEDIKKTLIETSKRDKSEDFTMRFREAFSWNSVIDEHMKCYAEILNEPDIK